MYTSVGVAEPGKISSREVKGYKKWHFPGALDKQVKVSFGITLSVLFTVHKCVSFFP